MVRLHETHGPSGFEVLAFPCNQFGAQEPGDCEDVANFARERFGARFEVMEKVNVNGQQTHPVFKFLKSASKTTAITWNFGVYFLVTKRGTVTAHPDVSPAQLDGLIRGEL